MANYRDLGGGDYHDIMSGVNLLIKRGIADANHLAVFGWSYGGYLTNWIITQAPQFKAAITGDGLSDLISMAGTSDIPWFLSQYLGDAYWNNAQLYLTRSPIMYVKNIQAPLLILHGGNDLRVPLGQGTELYQALVGQHKPVTLLIAPGQGHVPDNLNDIAQEITAVDVQLKTALM
jgi:dipeptidyl aminopeptidase/acylaminoacyl peptidase